MSSMEASKISRTREQKERNMSRCRLNAPWIVLGIAFLALPLLPARGQILVCDHNLSNISDQILEFSTTGTLIRSFSTPVYPGVGSALLGPAGMAVGSGSDLFVTSQYTGQVLRYDWKAGQYADVFAANLYAPGGLLYDRENNSLYVSEFGQFDGKTIVRYNATTGAEIARFGATAPGQGRSGMALGADGKLYVSNFNECTVTRFDPANNYAAEPFATVPSYFGINGVAFDRNGNLNVAGMMPTSVYQFNAAGAATAVGSFSAGMYFPSGLVLDADGNLLVTSMGNDNPVSGDDATGYVGKYNPTTGEVINAALLTHGTNPLFQPSAITLEPANTRFWSGSGTGSAANSWQNADNWGGAAPAANAALCFGATTAGGHVANDNDFNAGTEFDGITFTREATAYVLQGNKISLGGPVINQSAANQTIGLDVDLVAGGGLFDTGNKNVTVAGAIGGPGSLLKQGAGELILNGTLNYAGSTTVTAGTLRVANLIHSPEIAITRAGTQFFAASIVADKMTIGTPAGAAHAVPEPSGIVALLLATLGVLVFPLWRRNR
jgi:autotransporter-associated beta strand protein